MIQSCLKSPWADNQVLDVEAFGGSLDSYNQDGCSEVG